MKHTLYVLPHQRDRIDHQGVGNDVFQMWVEHFDQPQCRVLRQRTAQRQVEMEVVKDKRIAPIAHLLFLTGSQRRFAAARHVFVRQRRAEGIKRLDRRCGELKQRGGLGLRAQGHKATVITQRERANAEGRLPCRKVRGGILQSRQITSFGEVERRFQRAMKPVFARRLRDLSHVNAAYRGVIDSTASSAVPAKPTRSEVGQWAGGRIKNCVSFKHFVPPQMHSLCQISVTPS